MIEERRQEPHAFLYSFSAMKPPPCSSLLFPIDHACLGSFRLQEPTHVGAENPGHKFTTSISHHVDMWARMHNAASQYPIGIMCVTYGDFVFFKKNPSLFIYFYPNRWMWWPAGNVLVGLLLKRFRICKERLKGEKDKHPLCLVYAFVSDVRTIG